MSPALLAERADRKLRFLGLLENPRISRVQRSLLDAGRLKELRKALAALTYDSVLDVGCGLGEGALVQKHAGIYVGIDNSFSRVTYAQKRFPVERFMVSDAINLPFRDQSFDLCMLLDTSHHLNNQEFVIVLRELARISRRYVVVSDPILTAEQSSLSRFFYQLDRGACFRTQADTEHIFTQIPELSLLKTFACRTFPGLYLHQGFLLKVTR